MLAAASLLCTVAPSCQAGTKKWDPRRAGAARLVENWSAKQSDTEMAKGRTRRSSGHRTAQFQSRNLQPQSPTCWALLRVSEVALLRVLSVCTPAAHALPSHLLTLSQSQRPRPAPACILSAPDHWFCRANLSSKCQVKQ